MAHGRTRRLITRPRLKWAMLLLTTAVLALSFVSLWHGFMVARYGPSSTTSVRMGNGGVEITWMHTAGYRRLWVGDYEPVGRNPLPKWFDWQSAPDSNGVGVGAWYVLMPLWVPDILLVAWTAWLWRKDRRPRIGQCHNCGYDLHGLNSGVVCPECGTPMVRNA